MYTKSAKAVAKMTNPALRQNTKHNAATELIAHKRRGKKFYNELKAAKYK